MAVLPLPITNGFYVSDSLPLSAQECSNWYVHIPEVPALAKEVLFGTPGSNQLATSGIVQQINRGSDVLAGIPYFVNGTQLVRLVRTVVDDVETFSIDVLGTITGTGRVTMVNNGTQLLILVPGDTSTGYIFTTDPDTLTTITDVDFKANGEPQYGLFVDGYFLLTTNSKKYIISALNDGLAYNATDRGTAETDPDDIVAPILFNNQVFIGGSITMEGVQNLPQGADFPFVRTGVFLQKGIFAPFSVVNTDNSFMFIGGGKDEGAAIWESAGGTPQKVSTVPIDTLLQSLSDSELTAIFAESYSENGEFFVAFALPKTTLTLNTRNGRWHERKSQIVDGLGATNVERSRVNSIATAYGRILVGDSQDGRIGELSTRILKEYGADIVRIVATQPFQNNMKPFSVPSIELTMEAGVGNVDAPDPQIRMARSTDGGKTFSDDRQRPIGKVGEYGRRTIWNRNGRAARFEVFRFTLSDPVKPVILQLTADIVG